jgi:hypothetical protein
MSILLGLSAASGAVTLISLGVLAVAAIRLPDDDYAHHRSAGPPPISRPGD